MGIFRELIGWVAELGLATVATYLADQYVNPRVAILVGLICVVVLACLNWGRLEPLYHIVTAWDSGHRWLVVSGFGFCGALLGVMLGYGLTVPSGVPKKGATTTPSLAQSVVALVAAQRPAIAPLDTQPQKSTVPASHPPEEELSPFLTYGNKQVQINNGGRHNFSLWGFVYGNGPITPEKEPRLIVPGTYLFIDASQIESQVLDKLNDGQFGFLTCRVLITTSSSQKKTIRCSMAITRKNDQLAVNTSVIDIADGWLVDAIPN
jgi:hypothetical protein